MKAPVSVAVVPPSVVPDPVSFLSSPHPIAAMATTVSTAIERQRIEWFMGSPWIWF